MKVDLSQLELVSIDGELALVIRLGARAGDPVAPIERVTRPYRFKQPDTDTLGPFLAAKTKRQRGARYRASVALRDYQAWCEANGVEALGRIQFSCAMKARGFRQVRSNGHWWLDLLVLDTAQAGPLL